MCSPAKTWNGVELDYKKCSISLIWIFRMRILPCTSSAWKQLQLLHKVSTPVFNHRGPFRFSPVVQQVQQAMHHRLGQCDPQSDQKSLLRSGHRRETHWTVTWRKWSFGTCRLGFRNISKVFQSGSGRSSFFMFFFSWTPGHDWYWLFTVIWKLEP